MAKLKVLARSTPQDKFALVVGMQKLGSIVAVTGESHNDTLALETADVGFCMGNGCETAKDAADMILMDDNFASTLHAVIWGRNIYQNIRKFLQFQMTVNITVITIVFFGCVTKGYPSLSIV